MFSGVDELVLAGLESALVLAEPFPHCVVDDVFPAGFYEDIVDHWPQGGEFVPLSRTGRTQGAYEERGVVLFDRAGFSRLEPLRREFWRRRVAEWLMSQAFARRVVRRFASELAGEGLEAGSAQLAPDALIVSDRTGYAIGPHTDSPRRIVSVLFYLPEDSAFRRFGTSLYAPKDSDFRCKGGPHYDRSGFNLVKTVEFVPNRMIAFPKTDRSFHGVEPVDLSGAERRLLIYDVQHGPG